MSGDGRTSRRWRKMRLVFRAEGEAANAPCWLCGMEIDYSIPRLDPRTNTLNDDAWEPDHVLTRTAHPEYAEDPTNLRHSHGGCNRERSDRAPSRPITKPSRRWLV